jgi:hypothetical protein
MLYELFEGGGRLVQRLVRSARSSRLPLGAGSRWCASTKYTSPGSTGFHIPYRTPRRARRKHLVQLVQLVHFNIKMRTSRVASPAQDKPEEGGLSKVRTGQERLMALFLSRSTSVPGGCGERATRRRGGTNRLTGYEPARTKKPSRMPLPGGLVRSPTEPRNAREMEPRTARTAYPQSREPNLGHIRER